jgi:bla regulator protein BlaR1
MVVEAAFWPHPLVWCLESKLVEERERACDEEVLHLGNDPEVYAESLLSVCKHYLESPLVCLSAVSGGRLRQRIDCIMANYATRKLDFSREFMLLSAATAPILAPIVLGLVTRQTSARSKLDTPKPLAFEVASIKAAKNTIGPNTNDISPGGQRFSATNSSLKLFIMLAYDVSDRRVSGGPGWVNTDSYDIEAKAEHPASRQQIHLMLQSLLAERFNLRLHRETKELPMYVLTAENYRTHLRENTSGGEFRVSRGSSGQLVFENAPMSQLTWFLSARLRSDVEDKTGLTGKYDFEIAPMPTGPETADHNPNSSGGGGRGEEGGRGASCLLVPTALQSSRRWYGSNWV